jgi:hypothetical protein
MSSNRDPEKNPLIILYCPSILVSSNSATCTEVKIGASESGTFLFSDSFGPCQAVAAKLKNGEFAIYHASSHYDDTVGIKNFINKIVEGEASEVYIFEKSKPGVNLTKSSGKAAALSIVLTNQLLERKSNAEVKRIQLDTYLCIVADEKTNQLVLSSKMHKVETKENSAVTFEAAKTIIDKSKFISIKSSVEELQAMREEKYYFPEVIISDKSAKKLFQESSTAVLKALTTPEELKKITTLKLKDQTETPKPAEITPPAVKEPPVISQDPAEPVSEPVKPRRNFI